MAIWQLNKRQRLVLQLIANGFTNSQIAQIIGLSKSVVENVNRQIFKNLNVRNKTAAVVCGIVTGEICELQAYDNLEQRQRFLISQELS